MTINSDTKSTKQSVKINFIKPLKENPYINIMAWITIVSITMNFLPISWGVGILLFFVIGTILTFALNSKLGYYNNLKFNYYFSLVLFFMFISSPAHIIPMINDFQTAERIDETLTLDKETKLYYNDANNIFILFIDGEKQPLVIDKGGSSETYNRLKAGYLDNKMKVERKKVKTWYSDTTEVGYYLDGYKFD